jgi:beta-glucosidase
VAAANPNTVVILLCGSVVECPWVDRVKGILYMGLPGQAGGEAAADLLLGRANPSGKLAETWPMTYDDVPSSDIYGKTKDALYEEGIYVGYRYYDKAGIPVRWPFGYGLSYTSFAYTDLAASDSSVSVTVTNTGRLAGSEVVQLFLGMPQDGLHRPLRELKGFQKVFLQPGEAQRVTFVLTDRTFALWQDGWKVPAGRYTVSIGGLTASMEKRGGQLPVPAWQKNSWYAHCTGKLNQQDWETMMGASYHPPVLKKGDFTMDNTVMEMKDYSLIMKIMYKAVESTVAKNFGGKRDYENPDFRMMMNSSAGAPLRSMQISGGIKGGVLPGMLEMANGHWIRGIRKMIFGK